MEFIQKKKISRALWMSTASALLLAASMSVSAQTTTSRTQTVNVPASGSNPATRISCTTSVSIPTFVASRTTRARTTVSCRVANGYPAATLSVDPYSISLSAFRGVRTIPYASGITIGYSGGSEAYAYLDGGGLICNTGTTYSYYTKTDVSTRVYLVGRAQTAQFGQTLLTSPTVQYRAASSTCNP
jgi:hypothetical protein